MVESKMMWGSMHTKLKGPSIGTTFDGTRPAWRLLARPLRSLLACLRVGCILVRSARCALALDPPARLCRKQDRCRRPVRPKRLIGVGWPKLGAA